ncbi:hypothetical protein LAZ67_11003638 [Cordylochernes scorpioides]|uniref:C2H2-type domain-containing protein n=1 Tax=Cordylochernes scorpioides TaxID=51811 RepID=A0ABY6L0S6_9ARAC|nr:hypothetical protein LAZ67_11003638 [Cordylochernes scorpioides]
MQREDLCLHRQVLPGGISEWNKQLGEIDGTRFEVDPAKGLDIILDSHMHRLTFGLHSGQLLVDGTPYDVYFGEPRHCIRLGAGVHTIQLCGPPPEVKLNPDKLSLTGFQSQGTSLQDLDVRRDVDLRSWPAPVDFRSPPAPVDPRFPPADFRSSLVDFRPAPAPVVPRFSPADPRFPPADFRSPLVDFRPALANFRSAPVDPRSPPADFRSPLVDFRPALANFRSAPVDPRSPPPPADFRFPPADPRAPPPPSDFRFPPADPRAPPPPADFRFAPADPRSPPPPADFRFPPADPRAPPPPADFRFPPADPRSPPADPRCSPADPRSPPADPRCSPADFRFPPADPRAPPPPADFRFPPADPRAPPPPADFRFPPADPRTPPPPADFRFPPVDPRSPPPPADFRFPPADPRSPPPPAVPRCSPADFRFPPADFRFPPADFTSPLVDFRPAPVDPRSPPALNHHVPQQNGGTWGSHAPVYPPSISALPSPSNIHYLMTTLPPNLLTPEKSSAIIQCPTSLPSEEVLFNLSQMPPSLLQHVQPHQTSSLFTQTQPSSVLAGHDVSTLYNKLVDCGIITKTSSAPKEVPLTFDPKDFRVKRPQLIVQLYSGMSCSSCGLRLKKTSAYKDHLDWHFRINRRENQRKSYSRPWFYRLEDWNKFVDTEDTKPCFFMEEEKKACPEPKQMPSVLANDSRNRCTTCWEIFDTVWQEELEEWHFQNAVLHDDLYFHPSCLDDFKLQQAREEQLSPADRMGQVEPGADRMGQVEPGADWMNPNEPMEVSEMQPDSDVDELKSEPTDSSMGWIEKPTDSSMGIEEPRDNSMGLIEEQTDCSMGTIEEQTESPEMMLEEISNETEEVSVPPSAESAEYANLSVEMFILDTEESDSLDESPEEKVVLGKGRLKLRVRPTSIAKLSAPAPPPERIEEPEYEVDFTPPSPDPRFQQLPEIWSCYLLIIIQIVLCHRVKILFQFEDECCVVFFFLISTKSYQGINEPVDLVDGVVFFLISTQSY